MKSFYIIILSFISNISFSVAQTLKHEWYLTDGDLCNAGIVLFEDGAYIHESGCEASSHISYGKWIQKKDTVKFYVIDNKKFKVIKNIVATKTDTNYLTVKILDNRGMNITNKLLIGQFVKGKGMYTLGLDSTKMKMIDYKRDNGIIVLKSIENIFEQQIRINTDSSNYFEITLNFSGDWIYNLNSDWGGFGNFVLIKGKDGLTSIRPDYLDSDGILKKTIYKRK